MLDVINRAEERRHSIFVVEMFATEGGQGAPRAGRRKARRGLHAVRAADRPGKPRQGHGGARSGLRQRREADQRRAAQSPPAGGATCEPGLAIPDPRRMLPGMMLAGPHGRDANRQDARDLSLLVIRRLAWVAPVIPGLISGGGHRFHRFQAPRTLKGL
jgi:hypothetical protein